MRHLSVLFRLLLTGQWIGLKFTVDGQAFDYAAFESEWLPIRAQNNVSSFLEVQHNLGEVPALVEVLVKSTAEPNMDFIFKGIGTGGRDDNRPQEYGSVVYFYNDNNVRVYAPNRKDTYSTGYAIHTGEPGYWTGVNTQKSRDAMVKVRCWLPQQLPDSCFEASNITLVAGSITTEETYVELAHNLDQWPSIVSVRAKMLDGPYPGWYTDGQGSNMVWVDVMGQLHKTGGLVYGYNDETIRIWTSSVPHPANVLFAINDGWGRPDEQHGLTSSSGSIEVRAWCTFNKQTQKLVWIGPEVPDEQLEFELPGEGLGNNMFVSVKVIPRNGQNQGFLFDGIGGAMRYNHATKAGTPCKYGGLVFAYNTTTIRVWRPSQTEGGAVCIGSQMGQGINSQATNSVKLLITVWTWGSTTMTDLQLRENIYYEDPRMDKCARANRLAKDAIPTDDSNRITTVIFSTSVLHCHDKCLRNSACLAFCWNQDTCNLYNSTTFAHLSPLNGSEIWIFE